MLVSPTVTTARPRAPRGETPLVLVVDDTRDAREVYGEYFRFRGWRVNTAASGFEAVTKASRLRPHAIVLDLVMPPGMDGWEVLRRLRRGRQTRAIPVVAVTGVLGEEARAEALAAGFAAFHTKPCRPADLFAAVRATIA